MIHMQKQLQTKLSINLNKVALLRNARDLNYPSIIKAVHTSIKGGADGITVHPRPDERHIRRTDVYAISELLKINYPSIEFNIEGNPLMKGFLELIEDICPTQCTLVPDSIAQSTSDHGLGNI